MAQHIETKNERPLKSYWLKNFLPVDTTDSRLALPNDSLCYDLMNCQPVGFSNLHSIDDIGTPVYTFPASSQIFKTWTFNLNGTQFLMGAGRDGSLWGYDLTNNSARQIAEPGTFSGSDAIDVTQYDNITSLIIDTDAYYEWPDTVVDAGAGGTREVAATPVSSANGAPSGGQAIAVYQNMVWIGQGRRLFYSKAGLATDTPPGYQMFDAADGGGFTDIIDPTLNGNITKLFVANGFLYVFGETSIHVISDVYVPQSTAVPPPPPTPTFTLLNISAIVGTDQPQSIMAYGRLILFANKWGAWQLYGTTVQLISAPDPANNYLSSINGTWQYLTFAKAMPWPGHDGSSTYTLRVSAGQVVTNRLLCAAFLVWRDNDPIFGMGVIILMWFSDAAGSKWWSAYYGEGITSVVTLLVDNTPALFAIQNNALVQLFADPTSSPAARIMTALWDFGDPISDKQAIRAGVRMNIWGNPELVGAAFYIDTIRDSFQVPLGPLGLMPWKNAQGGAQAAWTSSAGVIEWANPMRFLTYWAAAPNCFDKHLGFTLKTAKGTSFELNGFLLDYKVGARWAGT